MGIWDYISGSAESLRRNSPDLTAVKTFCYSSYGSVKSNGGNLVGRFWPREETRSKIGPFAFSVAKYSAEEGIKFIPGGSSTYKIIKKSIHDINKPESEDQKVDVKALSARLSMLETELSHYKKLIDRPVDPNNAMETLDPDSKLIAARVETSNVMEPLDPDSKSIVARVETNKAMETVDPDSNLIVARVETSNVMEPLDPDSKSIVARVETNKAMETVDPDSKSIVARVETNEAMKTLDPDSNPFAAIAHKPEDVIRVFMMKEFMGTKYLSDLLVPGTSQNKK